jgi:prepilin-type processing-associated H-X9-DG protein/prepilin-type N-terminal cleavage/methylation domain-containing protein
MSTQDTTWSAGKPPSRQSAGFSLLELLVVIAILSLLMGLLLPALSSAREHTRGVTCATNMRQLAVGWQMYADAEAGVCVPGRFGQIAGSDNLYFVGNGWKRRPRWFAVIGSYVGQFAFTSPDPDDEKQNVDGKVYIDPTVPVRTNERNYTYGYNFQFLGNPRLTTDGSGRFINYPVSQSEILTARTVMAADSLGTAATFPPDLRTSYRADGGREVTSESHHGWALDPPRLWPGGDFCDDAARGSARSAPDPRHRGRSNFAFCDGHVESARPDEMGYVIDQQGAYPLYGVGSNHLFSGTGSDITAPAVAGR